MDIKSILNAIKNDTYIRAHIAWVIGFGCFLFGFILGHIRL